MSNNEMVDMTEVVRIIVDCVCEMKGRYGLNKIAGILAGSKSTKLIEIGAPNFETYGMLSEYSEDGLKILMTQLIKDDFLIKTSGGYPIICPGRRIIELANSDFCYLTKVIIEKKVNGNVNKKITGDYEMMTDSDRELYQYLRELRKKLAIAEDVPQYIVFSNKTLMNIAVMHPMTLEELINIPGVGEKKIDKYGELIIQEIKNKVNL